MQYYNVGGRLAHYQLVLIGRQQTLEASIQESDSRVLVL